jgi:hypothetical protein
VATPAGVVENRPVLPEYWLERPPLRLDRATESAIDELLSLGRPTDPERLLDVDELLRARGVAAPWQFLSGLAERSRIAFHGTGDPGIRSFEPRQPIDFAPFGDRKAVFATTDPIWAMFYAVVDRGSHQLTLVNGCISLLDEADRPGTPHYTFSISRGPLGRRPWRTGYVYLLPAEGFVEQEAGPYAGAVARVPQLASPVAVTPFARLRVGPEDFPFLDRVGGHDDDRLAEYARAMMAAEPWPE